MRYGHCTMYKKKLKIKVKTKFERKGRTGEENRESENFFFLLFASL